MPLIQETIYSLEERVTNNYFGAYYLGGGIAYSGESISTMSGVLKITRFDPANFIISGTFSFKAKEIYTGEIVDITNGRFDMQNTN